MNIDDLCGKSKANLPINKRYSADRVSAYLADLRRVLALEKEGKTRPARAELCSYFLEAYDIEVTPHTVYRHLQVLAQGKEIW